MSKELWAIHQNNMDWREKMKPGAIGKKESGLISETALT